MYLLVLVLDDSSRLNEVLAAWRDVGIKGITVLESTGVNRILPRDSAQPAFAGFSQIFGSGRVGHNTLFAITEAVSAAETAINSTEKVVGNLNDPNTGVAFIMPLLKTWGVPEG